MEFKHIPVLLDEVIQGLKINPEGTYLDCTIGGAGHSLEIIKRLTSGTLIGIDKDEEALKASEEKLKVYSNFKLIKGDFKDAKNLALTLGVDKLDGVLIDLGVSSYQLDEPQRGFSFLHDARLDMRMDRNSLLTAYDVVNLYDERELVRILYEFGEEGYARSIVKNILKARARKPIETTFQLKEIIENSIPKKILFKMGGASKKTFQAIRIEVNSELNDLDKVLKELIEILKPGGRMAVISFHSLEDRIVKNVFKEFATDCICPPKAPICICKHKAKIKIINKKPIVASEQEIEKNSRSSCAKLRVCEKI